MRKYLFMLIGILTTNAWSADPWNFLSQDRCWSMESSVYVGYLTVKSTNFVFNDYNPNWPHKISQLDWSIDNLWAVMGTARFNFLKDKLHVTLNIWEKIQAENALLVDRDFFDVNHSQDPSVVSKHPNTRLTNAYEIDTELSYDYFCWNYIEHNQKHGFLIGYKFLKLDWDAFGGYGFFKDQFEFILSNKQLAISYKESFYIPYIGLYSNWYWNHLNLRVYGKYTPLAYIKNEDFHPLRSINFVDKFHGATYWILGAELRWNICSWLDLDVKYSYDQLNKTRGRQAVSHASFGTAMFDSAGVRHFHHLLALGLASRF